LYPTPHQYKYSNKVNEPTDQQIERKKPKQQTIDTSTSTVNDASIEEQAHKLRLSDGDLEEEYNTHTANRTDPSSTTTSTTAMVTSPRPFRFIPLRMGGNGGTHVFSRESKALLTREVSLADLERMTQLFYDKAFADVTLDQFIRSHQDPHGSRFAKWIHQKLTGSHVWDDDRHQRDKTPVNVAGGQIAVVHDRSSAHAAAWYSPKRPRQQVGRHFQLDECRVWMRLHFWALRESGLVAQSPSFADYYIRFIAHFVRVYESKAPVFARDSRRWSANPENIDRYLKDGRQMKDVLGLSVSRALRQIPEDEYQNPE
jgi:hypothetical protein